MKTLKELYLELYSDLKIIKNQLKLILKKKKKIIIFILTLNILIILFPLYYIIYLSYLIFFIIQFIKLYFFKKIDTIQIIIIDKKNFYINIIYYWYLIPKSWGFFTVYNLLKTILKQKKKYNFIEFNYLIINLMLKQIFLHITSIPFFLVQNAITITEKIFFTLGFKNSTVISIIDNILYNITLGFLVKVKLNIWELKIIYKNNKLIFNPFTTEYREIYKLCKNNLYFNNGVKLFPNLNFNLIKTCKSEIKPHFYTSFNLNWNDKKIILGSNVSSNNRFQIFDKELNPISEKISTFYKNPNTTYNDKTDFTSPTHIVDNEHIILMNIKGFNINVINTQINCCKQLFIDLNEICLIRENSNLIQIDNLTIQEFLEKNFHFIEDNNIKSAIENILNFKNQNPNFFTDKNLNNEFKKALQDLTINNIFHKNIDID